MAALRGRSRLVTATGRIKASAGTFEFPIEMASRSGLATFTLEGAAEQSLYNIVDRNLA
jgi:hypothetical protein